MAVTTARELVESARAAVRGAKLGQDYARLLPASEAVTRAVAFAAVEDEEYANAHKRLAGAEAGTIEHEEAKAKAVRAYAAVAHRVASRAAALAANERACTRIVTEARIEQRGLTPYYFGPYVVGVAVAFVLGIATHDARLAGITFALVWFASVLMGAAVTRLRRRAFTHDVAQIMDPEAR